MAQPTFEFPDVWTEADLELLPADGHRYEILDGALHMTPAPNGLHQYRGDELRSVLQRAAPPGWRVVTAIGVRVLGGNLVPDIVVLRAGANLAAGWQEPEMVALVVEVASPSTEFYDRSLKALKYAQAGIENYWRLSRDGKLTIHTAPVGTEYTEVRIVAADDTVVVDQPFPATFVPGRLAD